MNHCNHDCEDSNLHISMGKFKMVGSWISIMPQIYQTKKDDAIQSTNDHQVVEESRKWQFSQLHHGDVHPQPGV